MTARKKVLPNPNGQPVATVQLKKIGNSTGVILPQDVMARLNLSVGDTFYATLSADGGIRLTPYDPKFEKAMEVARRGMKMILAVAAGEVSEHSRARWIRDNLPKA